LLLRQINETYYVLSKVLSINCTPNHRIKFQKKFKVKKQIKSFLLTFPFLHQLFEEIANIIFTDKREFVSFLKSLVKIKNRTQVINNNTIQI